MTTLDWSQLETEVARVTTVDGSVEALALSLADIIEAGKGDQAKLDEIVAKLRGDNDSLAAFVVANTPAAPPVTPTPTP